MRFPVVMHTALDAVDCRALAEFYRELLGLHYRPGDEPPAEGDTDDADWLVLLDDEDQRVLAVQEAVELVASTWPSPDVPMQLHLDLRVPTRAELDRHWRRAEDLGATLLLDRAAENAEPLVVLADPEGHPFCLLVAPESVPVPRPSPWPAQADGLVFREAVEADLDALLSFRNDPAVNRFMVRTHVDPDVLRREWLAVPMSATDFSCVVERDGEVVAMAFLDVVDSPGQPGCPDGTDGLIGYIVDPRFAGQGIASATARALLRAAFDGLGLRRVTAAAYADNPASVRVLAGAGMRRERLSVQALWHDELGWIDEVGYALLADEWRASPG